MMQSKEQSELNNDLTGLHIREDGKGTDKGFLSVLKMKYKHVFVN